MTDFHIRTDCRLCSDPIREVLRLPDTPLANSYPDAAFVASGQKQATYPLYLSQCEQCGHVMLPVCVKQDLLFPSDYPYCSGTSPVFRAHLKEFAATVSGMIPKGGKVLEIASNDGTLLLEFAALGCKTIVGLDPCAKPLDMDLVPSGTGTERIFTIPQFFNLERAQAMRENGYSFDAIVALNVFAHIDDLNDFTAGVAELLAPDGVFVFEVGYLGAVIEKGLVGCLYHEHLSIHSLRPLVPFFERHGLALYDAHPIDSQGGSIRCFVGRARPDLKQHYRLRELIRMEQYMPPVANLRATIEAKRSELVAWLHTHKLHGKKVAAFGAPAKLTTWSYALGLGPDDISCVYDDAPTKQGRFTPGNFWAIVPSSRLLEDQPDAVVLFSSNFEAEIRERFKAYRGEWIVV